MIAVANIYWTLTMRQAQCVGTLDMWYHQSSSHPTGSLHYHHVRDEKGLWKVV